MISTRFALLYPEATTYPALVNRIGMADGRLERAYNLPSELTRPGPW